jgi:hypothetical protein
MAPKYKADKSPEIDVTPRMLAAGLSVLEGGRGSYADVFLLKAVYTAMREAEKPDSSFEKSSRRS